MLFYNVVFSYDLLPLGKENPLAVRDDEAGKTEKWNKVLRDMNNSLDNLCKNFSEYIIFVTHGEWGKLFFNVACRAGKKYFNEAKKLIISMLTDIYKVNDIKMAEKEEILVMTFRRAMQRAANASIINGSATLLSADYKIDYFDNRRFKVIEYVQNTKKLTLKRAIQYAENIMAPPSFLEELQRIYSTENEKKFYGHPVHYKVTAGSYWAANQLIMLLVQALYSNQRLYGTRISEINNIDDRCYDEIDMENLFEQAEGSTVMIDLSGDNKEETNYASEYEEVIDYMSDLIIQHHNEVLCIFVEISGSPGFSAKMLSQVREHIDIIELAEGGGSREQVLEYLNLLVDESEYAKVKDRRLEDYLPVYKEHFSVTEVEEIYGKWCRNSLKRNIYRAYDVKSEITVQEKEKKTDAYEKLQAMVGLKDVKEIVEQMIASCKMQKLRQEMGLKQEKFSSHMLFTGNPGSAKTTVARLISSILKEEGILSTGKFVECGRSDLVGKYVGWTAKQVKSKFMEAHGGVLFIDEAYALVDDANSFGDEAINTIVQEMENNRDDVIVIFAGYPEKMLDFLDKNEGLRSRIAFHIDFPDYNAEELTEILKLMAEEKGYHIDTAIEKKCMDIFADACSQPEFGNGRYARNLLEQAIMKQSMRIFKENKGRTLDKQTLLAMDVSDFEVNAIMKKEKKPTIGFVI